MDLPIAGLALLIFTVVDEEGDDCLGIYVIGLQNASQCEENFVISDCDASLERWICSVDGLCFFRDFLMEAKKQKTAC